MEPIRLLAPNPGATTLDGTNTWVLMGDDGVALLIDPGPADIDHVLAIEELCRGGVDQIWVTHKHADHLESAPGLASRYGAPVRTYERSLSTGRRLREGERYAFHDVTLTVVEIPGHTRDSIGFLMEGPDGTDLFCGDMILGRGTTVIKHPDGDLAAYFSSLRKLRTLVADHGVRRLLPGHGPVITDPGARIDYYHRHRLSRLDQVREALAQGARTAGEVADIVYGDQPEALRPAAEASTRAQLAYLRHPR